MPTASPQPRPIMALLELLGRRWVLRILWELRDGDAAGFRELQARCDTMSPSVLSVRLGELEAAGILDRNAAGDYALTDDGRDLVAVLGPLNEWAKRWSAASAKGRDVR